MPSNPIERSYAGPGLLARIIPAKFAEHSPHYPKYEIYRRQGVELGRATLGRWSGAVSELLEPLYDRLRQYVLMPGKVHPDDIPVPIQEPGSGKARTALLWVYVRDDRNASPGGLVRVLAGLEGPAWPMRGEKSTTCMPGHRPTSPPKS